MCMKSKAADLAGQGFRKFQKQSFVETHRMNKGCFTRPRKLNFFDVSMIIMQNSNHGLYDAIRSYMDIAKEDIKCTEAAFCYARQKINYTAFRELAIDAAYGFYKDGNYKTMYGYRIWGIDGSDVNLPNTPSVLAEFGSQKTSGSEQAQALVSCLFDVLNLVTLTGEFAPCHSSERDLAKLHLAELVQFRNTTGVSNQSELIMCDRGYPSEGLIEECEKSGFNYIIRVTAEHFWQEVRYNGKFY